MLVGYADTLATNYPTLRIVSVGDDQTYSQIIPYTGSVLPDQATLDASRLSLTQDRMWRRIQTERDRRIANGVKVGTYWFHTDPSSRIQQLGLVLMGANLPTGIMWKTLGGQFVAMTPTLAVQIFQASGTQDATIFGVAEYHKGRMLATLPDPTVYNFMTAWPLTFGE
jgi:hypothetical protein